MGTQVYKLSFTGPVHFGNGRLTDDTCTFDAGTLFSALFIEALNCQPSCAQELLEAAQTGNLMLSDAFPWVGKSLYLPKPCLNRSQDAAAMEDGETASVAKKTYKKMAYVPLSQWEAFINDTLDLKGAQSIVRDLKQGLGTSGLVTKVNLAATAPQSEAAYEADAAEGGQGSERIDAEPYHVGLFQFAPEAGLYFMVRGTYDISKLMDALQYSGLGGKRTAGYGGFKCEQASLDLTAAQQVFPQGDDLLLSTAAPRPEELTDSMLEGAQYSIKRSSGFVQSSAYANTLLKRRELYPFVAGSVFQQHFEGSVYDVSCKGAHPVYRYAKAFWLREG